MYISQVIEEEETLFKDLAVHLNAVCLTERWHILGLFNYSLSKRAKTGYQTFGGL